MNIKQDHHSTNKGQTYRVYTDKKKVKYLMICSHNLITNDILIATAFLKNLKS